MTTYLSPGGSNAQRARAVAACSAPGGLVIPNWQRLVVNIAVSGSSSVSSVSTPLGVNPTLDGLGFCAGAVATDGTIWLLSYGGVLIQSLGGTGTPVFYNPVLATGTTFGTDSGSQLTTDDGTTLAPDTPSQASNLLPAGETWIGLVLVNNKPYVAAVSGRVFTLVSGTPTEVTPNFGTRISGLATDGTKLYAPLPGAGEVAVLALNNTAATVHTTPIANPSLLSVTTAGVLALAGTAPAVQAGGTSGVAATDAQVALSDAAAGSVTLLTGADPSYQAQTPVTGLAGAGAIAWSADGLQVLVACTAGLAILTLTAGVLKASQTLTPTGVTAIAVTPTGDEALLVQSGAGTFTALINSLETWNVTSPVSVPGISSVVMLSNLRAVVGTGTGIAYLARSGNAWSVETTTAVALGASVTALAVAPDGSILAATAGSLVRVTSTGSYAVLATWTGSAASVLVKQNQIAVLDTTAGLIRWFDLTGAAQGTHSAPAGASAFASSDESIWIPASDGAHQYHLYGPFKLRAETVGLVAVSANGTTWGSTSLGVGMDPAALAWDGTTVRMLTSENDMVSIAAPSPPAMLTPAVTTVGPYGDQSSTAPLGLAGLVSNGGHFFAPTLASGYVAEVT